MYGCMDVSTHGVFFILFICSIFSIILIRPFVFYSFIYSLFIFVFLLLCLHRFIFNLPQLVWDERHWVSLKGNLIHSNYKDIEIIKYQPFWDIEIGDMTSVWWREYLLSLFDRHQILCLLLRINLLFTLFQTNRSEGRCVRMWTEMWMWTWVHQSYIATRNKVPTWGMNP